MNAKPEFFTHWLPPSPDYYNGYIIPTVQPPVDVARLHLIFLYKEERDVLKTPKTGDMSFVLYYNRREGYITSMGDSGSDLQIVQLQGARQEGYRVICGTKVVQLMGDQIYKIATLPESPYERITLPQTVLIDGQIEATNEAIQRYSQLRLTLGLRYSHEEQIYARDVK